MVATPYSGYRDLLLRLHDLIADDQAESEQAGTLRDQMDQFWPRLDDQEVAQVRLLSWDLYGLDTQARDVAAAARFRELWLLASSQLLSKAGWLDLLRHLKACEGMFPASMVYYFKAKIWEHLEDSESSLRFFRRSVAAAAPEDWNLRYLLLAQLKRTKPEEALSEARSTLERQDAHPALLLKAVGLLMQQEETNEIVDLAAYAGYRDLLGKGVQQAELAGIPRPFLCGLHILAGRCWTKLGNTEEAENAFGRAAQAEPDSPWPLVARGMLNYGKKAPQALDDFKEAIRRRVPLVWPYFFLAHWSILNSHFEECIDYCNKGLQLAKDPDIAANLMHWRAVAQFCGQRNRENLRVALSRASVMSPENRWVGAELDAVENASADRRMEEWNLPDDSEVGQIGNAHLSVSLGDPMTPA